MIIEVKVPAVGESVKEALLAEWFKKDGDQVARDDVLFVIETDKVSLEVTAEAAGRLAITAPAGTTVAIGAVVGTIDTAAAATASTPAPVAPQDAAPPAPAAAGPPAPPPSAAAPAPAPAPGASIPRHPDPSAAVVPPSVRRLAAEKNIDLSQVQGTGPAGRITKMDVLLHLDKAPAGMPEPPPTPANLSCGPVEQVTTQALSPIRRRIAQRLVEAKQQTAMLTTFNEIDMSRVMALREAHKISFENKHGIGLGFMSFFVKACVDGLKAYPQINAFIEADQIVFHNYVHVGIAIGSGKGLVVPVIRHAESMGFADIEKAVAAYAAKVKNNRLELADLEGGTFTISNGGVYGSLLSTPILNMPQSGILGMHKIEKRPVVVDDQIVIRPMMYVALSYDHRIVDGREAVSFLVRVKQCIESPERMLLEI
jgi:2-oxoglutarate dehydrogenase E2 component (dihydrolipoamide succinyltransferase)